MGRVISFKTKKALSTKQVNKLHEKDKETVDSPKIAECAEDIPDNSLVICGLSGNEYALTIAALERVIYGESDITELEFYDDWLPKVLYEWLETIPE